MDCKNCYGLIVIFFLSQKFQWGTPKKSKAHQVNAVP